VTEASSSVRMAGRPLGRSALVDDWPAKVRERFFLRVALTLYHRLQIFTALPLEQLDKLKLEQMTRDIGRAREAGSDPAA
jgi:hypothetical protein